MIPGLVADLKGRVPIKIRIATQILGGRLIKSTVTDVPDLPVGQLHAEPRRRRQGSA